MRIHAVKPSTDQEGTTDLPYFLGTLAIASPRRMSKKARARFAGEARVKAFTVEGPKGKPHTEHRVVGMTRACLAGV